MNGNTRKLAIVLMLAAVFLSVFPPFHIRKLEAGTGAHGSSPDIARRASEFWKSSLARPRVPPVDLQMLLQALSHDPAGSGREYGRRPGIGGPWFYLVSGTARVASVDRRGVWLEPGDGSGVAAVLQTGPIFGSALRDATGLVRFEDFSSFDFNQLSEQFNHLSETLAQPALRRDARVGARVEFVAAGRLNINGGDGRTLLLAPIAVQVK